MNKKALEGIKVADFAWVGVGSIASRHLGDHGATLIHIESMTTPDILRVTPPYKDNKPGINRSAYFTIFNCNKYGITLNLNHPRAKEAASRLVKWADVVTESFTPGRMKQWGLAYDDLIKIKPDIVMFSTCQQGQTGPHAKQPAFGTQLVSLVGFTDITGWPDRYPVGPYGAYTDTTAPTLLAAALVAAIDYRRRTGKGIYIDMSQFEAGINFLTAPVLDYNINGRIMHRVGNRHTYAVPHAVFPSRELEQWITIAIFNDDEWQRFIQVIGSPSWALDERFQTILGRKHNEDELYNLVSTWTILHTAENIMHNMQAAGLEALMVLDARQIQEDPQLNSFNYLWDLDHLEMGPHKIDAPPFTLSRTPAKGLMGAPCMGQHNEFVYTKILGYTDEEFIRLMAEGVLE